MGFDLGGQGGNSFPFDNPGDTVTGKIIELEEVQQTDMDTGTPASWPDGRPKMQYRVTLQTDLSDDADDDGVRAVYLRGARKPDALSSLSAVLVAVKATTGGSSIDTGGNLTLTYTGDGVPSKRGYNAPKQYEATYRPPSADLDPEPVPAAAAATPQPGLKGHLNGKPIHATQYAGMVAAGISPESLPGWQPA